MYVRQLGLTDFRSWSRLELQLEPGRTVFRATLPLTEPEEGSLPA